MDGHTIEFAPRSVVARLTPKLVAGYKTYGFDEAGRFSELSRLGNDESYDLPGNEFWLGGEIVRNLEEDEKSRLKQAGAQLYANPERLFDDLGDRCGQTLDAVRR